MSADLTLLDESRPEGLKDRITQDPAKQRKTRLTLVDNFGVEHHLTGEHKFPNGAAFDRESAKPGQLYLHDDGLLMHGTAVFPVGAVRELLSPVGLAWGVNMSSGFAGFSGPGFEDSEVGGYAPYTGLAWNALTYAPAGASAGFYLQGVYNTTFAQLATIELLAGVYSIDGVVRYFTGDNGAGTRAMRIRLINAADNTAIHTHVVSNFETAAYDTASLQSFGRLAVDEFTFELSADATVEVHLYGNSGHLDEGDSLNLSVAGTTLRIRRVA